MVSLEQLTVNASVRGLVAGTTVKVVQVEWFGDQAVKVTFEEPTGAVRNRPVYMKPRLSWPRRGEHGRSRATATLVSPENRSGKARGDRAAADTGPKSTN